MPLTYTQARALKTNGVFRVDRGLYARVRRDGGSITWVFRYRRNGRTRFMGFGPLADVNLTEARDLADEAASSSDAGSTPSSSAAPTRARRPSRSRRPPSASSRRTRRAGPTQSTATRLSAG